MLIRLRRDTAANWASRNPILRSGEPGFVTDTGLLKIGDGVSVFAALTNAASVVVAAAASIAQTISVAGDTQGRLTINGAGLLAWGPGNSGQDTNLYRATTSLLQTDSTFSIASPGAGLRLAEGVNAKMGIATANGSTAVTVSTTAATANSRIFLSAQNPNAGTPGALFVSAITAGTSFAFKSSSATDASTVAWLIVDHT